MPTRGHAPRIALRQADDAAHPPLPGDEIHVWRASLEHHDSAQRALASLLDADERARAARFHRDLDRRRFAAARGVLRLLLGRYLGVPPRDVALVYGEQGKPSLAPRGGEPHPLRFNLSHCGDVALLAFVAEREIGVDVERPRAGLDPEAIAERFFSPREVAELRATPAGQRARAFALGWTRKEAYLKGLGSGLARPLADFTVSLAPSDPVPLVDEKTEGWVIRALEPGDGYAGAVAVERGSGLRVRWLEWVPALDARPAR